MQGAELNTSDDFYQYTYVKEGEGIDMITTTKKAVIEPDPETMFTVELCTICGCSENATKILGTKNSWNFLSEINEKNKRNQANYKDQEKYKKQGKHTLFNLEEVITWRCRAEKLF